MIMCQNDAALETQRNFKQCFLAIMTPLPPDIVQPRPSQQHTAECETSRVHSEISRGTMIIMINQLLKYLFSWVVSPFSSDHKNHHKNHFNY